jgi:hypothetical protein
MIAAFTDQWRNVDFWLPTVNAFFGAGLGASFYILLNTQSYLVNRSFDPKYNAVYAARFITGLVAGVILATALGPVLQKQLESSTKYGLTPGILAILGGYAAEAVQQILQRLVEVLLAVVRGDGSAQAQAKATAALADKNAEVRSKLIDLEKETDDKKRKQILSDLHATLKRSDPP